jgi:hypothetical protein
VARKQGQRAQLPEQQEQRHRDRELSELDAEVKAISGPTIDVPAAPRPMSLSALAKPRP